MVLKSKKHNVASGNTLKGSSSAHKHGHAPSTLVRVTENIDPEDSHYQCAIDDVLPEGDGVAFSLNKKGRWNIPSMLKEKIVWSNANEDCKVSMLERHNLKKQANCIGYYTNQGLVRKVEHQYFSGDSFTKKGKGRRRKKRGKQEEEEKKEEEVDETPEIRYEVCYASPKTSSVSYNPKYMKDGPCEDGKSRGAGRKNKKRNKQAWQDDWFPEDDTWDEEIEDEKDDDNNEPCEDSLRREQSILGDLLEKALATDQRYDDFTFVCASALKTESVPPQKFGKGCTVYMDKDEMELSPGGATGTEDAASEVTDTSPARQVPELVPVTISVYSQTVEPGYLRNKYDIRFKEANCMPRKFSIHFKRDDMSMERAWRRMSKCLDTESYVIFEEISRTRVAVDMRVSLNGDFNMNSIGLETLLDTKTYSIEEVIRKVQKYFYMVPTDCFNPAKPKAANTTNGASNLLNGAFKYQVESKMAEDAYKALIQERQESTGVQRQLSHTGGTTMAGSEHYCNVCYESLDCTTGTALRACKHWFCNECWREHLTIRVRDGALRLYCPAYKCAEEVDDITFLSVVNLRYHRQHQQHVGDSLIQQSEEYRWCPQPRCGQLIRVAGEGAQEVGVSVKCRCGKSMCFTCFGEAHWPATCEQAEHHTYKLKKNGDYVGQFKASSTTYIAKVKHCPRCNYPMEKNGGCPHMGCKCGYDFCWTCLEAWEGHQWNVRCLPAGKAVGRERYELKHVELHPERDGASKLYNRSLVHHLARSHPKVKQRKDKALELVPKIQSHNSTENKRKRLPSASSDVSTDSGELVTAFVEAQMSLCKDVQAVKTQLINAAGVSTELHHLAENITVFLSDASIDREKYRRVRNILEHVEFVCTILDRVLSGESREDVGTVSTKLENLISRGKQLVARLVNVLRKHKSDQQEQR